MGKCEDCKSYGMINKKLGERCFVKGEIKYPSGFKNFNGCVRAYPIPKEGTCKNFTPKVKTTNGGENND
jgi:hypothetical protein